MRHSALCYHQLSTGMRIVQTVFGVFHHFDLARQLHRRGHLEKIFTTWPRARVGREQIPPSKVDTFPWIHTPEYLLRRAGLLSRWMDDQTGYANALAFDAYTYRRMPACDALIAISGSSLRSGKLVQQRGGVFICDRGSSHQRYQEQIVSEEFRRWKVDLPVSDIRDTLREERIYEQADAITVPSTFAARSFIEMGVPPEKIFTIPYGVQLENFKPSAPPPTSSFEVLFAGSVGLRKGLPYLLQAFSQLRHPHKRLRIVGAISAEMPPILQTLPLEHVEFLGAVPQAELASIMSSSHVMVLPSIEEGLALVQGQALASGCPVLASTNTGAEDLFTDGVEGFIVPIRDANALLHRLQQLADDPDLQARMREAALVRVRSIGGWNEYGDRWEKVLEKLIASNSTSAVHNVALPPPTK